MAYFDQSFIHRAGGEVEEDVPEPVGPQSLPGEKAAGVLSGDLE